MPTEVPSPTSVGDQARLAVLGAMAGPELDATNIPTVPRQRAVAPSSPTSIFLQTASGDCSEPHGVGVVFDP